MILNRASEQFKASWINAYRYCDTASIYICGIMTSIISMEWWSPFHWSASSVLLPFRCRNKRYILLAIIIVYFHLRFCTILFKCIPKIAAKLLVVTWTSPGFPPRGNKDVNSEKHAPTSSALGMPAEDSIGFAEMLAKLAYLSPLAHGTRYLLAGPRAISMTN